MDTSDGYTDAQGKTHAAGGAGQGRAITRGEEARVREALGATIGAGDRRSLQYDAAGRLTYIEGEHYSAGVVASRADLARAGIVPGAEGWCWAAPAATSNGPDDDTTARMLGVDIERVRFARERGSKDDQALLARAGFKPGLHGWQWSAATAPPPAWLTAAVLAALPCDGTILDHQAIVRALCTPRPGDLRHAFSGDDVTTALDFLVVSGEIETDNIHGVRWRRWGVPEGFRWMEHGHGVHGLDGPMPDCRTVARAHTTGRWTIVDELCGGRREVNDVAQPPTLAAARQAALRACYERGVFGPRPAPAVVAETPQGAPSRQAYDPARIRERLAALLTKGPRKALDLLLDVLAIGAPEGFALPDLRANLTAIGARRVYAGSGEQWEVGTVPDPIADVTPAPHFDTTPAPTRAEQVRLALLAVLTRGPVVGLANVLTALDGEGVQPAADGREARQAAAEIGAVIDGARWALSEGPPPGWGWVRALTHALYLAPHGSDNAIADSIANVSARDSLWTVTEPGADGKVIERGEGVDDADATQQALAAARRAGLFARPVAVEVTGDGGPPVLPAVTSQGGEAVVTVAPSSPLDALALAICVYPNARVPEVRDALAAWGAELVEQARAPRHTIEAVGEQGGTVTTLGAHPHRDGNEEPWETIERLARSLDETKRELEAMEVHGDEQRERAKRAERGAAEARTSIGVAIRQRDAAERERDEARAKLATIGAEIDALHARWAGAR